MVRLFRNILLYRKFIRTLKKCDKMNRDRRNDLYIVANICGLPYIINRRSYRKLRTQGIMPADLYWKDVYEKRITYNTIKKWIS